VISPGAWTWPAAWTWLAAACLLLAAAAVGWPGSARRARRRRLLAAGEPLPGPVVLAGRWVTGWRARRPRWWAKPQAEDPLRGRLPAGLAVLVVAGLAAALGGPVAALAVGAYGATAVRALYRQRSQRALAARRSELLDLLGAAAADLRAGLPASAALAGVAAVDGKRSAPGRGSPGWGSPGVGSAGVGSAGQPGPGQGSPHLRAGHDLLSARVGAAVRLAEQTGAPLATVIERIEADARSTDRSRAAAAAQMAGAQATAILLAALPAAGIGLGYAIGADPLPVLLHTPIGAVAAIAAVGLQLAGLGWAARLTRPAPVGAP
jgi:tight adherence protein B